MTIDWYDKLRHDLALLPYSVADEQVAQLKAFVELLNKWSSRINITAIKELEEIVTKHILDSLSVRSFLPAVDLPALESKCVMIDMGTGGGLPGIPLAIMERNRPWVLVDSNAKKIQFLRHVCAQLRLDNVVLKHQRIEQLTRAELNLTENTELALISRAFAPLQKMLQYVEGWLRPGQLLYLMLGKTNLVNEQEHPGYQCIHSEALIVPGLAASRHLCILKKDAE